MQFEKYIEMQRKLDLYIEERHPKGDASRLAEKTLALIVEVAEMVNELPGEFKYWSTKQNNMEKALGEYVDVFHFLLSIGIEMEFERLLSNACSTIGPDCWKFEGWNNE